MAAFRPELKILFVVGPTASGKSALALQWARTFGAEIINCDSLQTYKGLDIGTAKPSLDERAILPHHLFDYIPLGQAQTAGSYSRDFFELLASRDRGNFIVVGGTGFYFRAIENGMFSVGKSDPAVVAKLTEELLSHGPVPLWQELQKADPQAASRIFPKDHYRLVRALEMIRGFDKTPTQMREEILGSRRPFPYPLKKVGTWAERADLEDRVRQRTEKMLEAGLLAEVRALLDAGLGEWPPLQSVGYAECLEVLKGNMPLSELPERISASTLRLAKKQRTWFRRDPEIRWFPVQDRPSAPDREICNFFGCAK